MHLDYATKKNIRLKLPLYFILYALENYLLFITEVINRAYEINFVDLSTVIFEEEFEDLIYKKK